MSDYIKFIREKVGRECIFLNFSGACITNEKGELLLQKRSATENKWGLPGGCVELGESVKEAVIREVKEETGYDISVNHMIGIYSKYFTEYPNGDVAQSICTLFDCSIIGGHAYIDHQETFDLRFFDTNALPELFIQQHRDMVDDFLNNRSGIFR